MAGDAKHGQEYALVADSTLSEIVFDHHRAAPCRVVLVASFAGRRRQICHGRG
jgi:hypothetical protein